MKRSTMRETGRDEERDFNTDLYHFRKTNFSLKKKVVAWIMFYTLKNMHGKNSFIKVSKNLTRYKSVNNFVNRQNNYAGHSSIISKKLTF